MVTLKDQVMFLIIEKGVLTDELVQEYGLEEEISNGSLVKNEDGTYRLANIDELYNFCLRLASEDRDHYYIYHGLEICHQNKLKHSNVLDFFYASLNKKDYKLAFAYIKAYYYSNNRPCYNLLLYLLSLVYKLPDYYYQFLHTLDGNDFLIKTDAEAFTKRDEQNFIIEQIRMYKWLSAIHRIEKIEKTVYKKILLVLLKEVSRTYESACQKCLWFIYEKDYKGLQQYLLSLEKRGFSTDAIKSYQIMVDDIVNSEKTNHIPENKDTDKDKKAKLSVDGLIAARYYEEALKIKKAVNWYKGKVNIKLLLLQEVNDRINKSKDPNYETPYLKYVEDCVDYINQYGLMIVDYASQEEFYQKLYAASKVDGIVPYVLKNKEEMLLVFKTYEPYEQKDYKKINSAMHKAYHEENYVKSIEFGQRGISMSVYSMKKFAMIGLSYLNLGHVKPAIDYLTIATTFACTVKSDKYNFSNTIAQLKSMNEMDFDSNKEASNELDIEQIFSLINEGNSIEAVCAEFDLDDEHKNILYLVLAKEFYSQSLEAYGDECVKRVQRSKDKSDYVKTLLQETINNKRIYLNKSNDYQALILNRNFKVLFSKI